MDKRERVARAIWAEIDRLDQLPLSEQPDTSTVDTQMQFTRMLADAAIAALEPVTVQEAARVLMGACLSVQGMSTEDMTPEQEFLDNLGRNGWADLCALADTGEDG